MAPPPDIKTPALTPIDIQGLLNKPAPTVSAGRPVSIQYSPTNLPQFMADRQEVAPGLFGRVGLLGIAPQVSSIQSTMPQQYVDEYADLERAFQESYAARPEYFGRDYSVGQFVPGVPQLDVEPIGADYGQLAAQATGIAAATQLYPEIKDALPELKTDIFDPLFEPVDDIADVVFEPAKIAVDKVQQIIPEGVGTSIQEVKDDLFETISDTFGFEENNTIGKLKETFSGVESAVKDIGNIENVVTNPSAQNMRDAVDSIESLYDMYSGSVKPVSGGAVVSGQFIPEDQLYAMRDPVTGELPNVDTGSVVNPAIKNALIGAAGAYNVYDFVSDPSVEKAPEAYASASAVSQSLGGQALPGASTIAPLASIYSGVDALKGGIDSPGELASVASGIGAAANLAGINTGILGGLGAAATPLALAQLTMALPDLIEGGAAGDFPRFESTIGLDNGNFDIVDKTAYDQGTDFYTGGQAQNALDFVNYMVDNLGYKVDQEGYKSFQESDADTIVDEYGYFTERHGMEDPSHNAADFVANMLKYGAIKPTEDTPLDFNINEAIQILDPNVSAYSPQEEQFASRNTDIGYILGETYGRATPEMPEITPEMIASLPELQIPDMSFLDLSFLPTTGIADDPRTRLREDIPVNMFGLEGLLI